MRGRILADRGDIDAARTCFNETRNLFLEEETRDPENRGVQLNLAVIDTNLGNLDLSEDRFADAARHYEAARDRLTRLDRAGNLDDQYTIREVYLPGSARLLDLCKAAEQVLEKPEVAERFPVVHRSFLLCLRVRQLARRSGMSADLLATARRVCELEASEHDDLLAKAIACVRCGKVIDQLRGAGPGTKEIDETRKLCREQALDAMNKVFPMSAFGIIRLEHVGDYRPLREDPEIMALIARQKEKAKQNDTSRAKSP